jgi:hypothetical protein
MTSEAYPLRPRLRVGGVEPVCAMLDYIAYPGPPVPVYFAQALVATKDHRFYTDPGVDPHKGARKVWLL